MKLKTNTKKSNFSKTLIFGLNTLLNKKKTKIWPMKNLRVFFVLFHFSLEGRKIKLDIKFDHLYLPLTHIKNQFVLTFAHLLLQCLADWPPSLCKRPLGNATASACPRLTERHQALHALCWMAVSSLQNLMGVQEVSDVLGWLLPLLLGSLPCGTSLPALNRPTFKRVFGKLPPQLLHKLLPLFAVLPAGYAFPGASWRGTWQFPTLN